MFIKSLIKHIYNFYKFSVASVLLKYGTFEIGDILITTKCPVACSFCIYNCNLKGENMPLKHIEELCKGYKKHKVKEIRLLGGEPFYTDKLLIDSFNIAKKYFPEKKIKIVTSGYFAVNQQKTAEKLEPLINIGLKEIQLSFDFFHLEKIPVKSFVNVLKFSKKAKLKVTLNIMYNDKLLLYLNDLKKLKQQYQFDIRFGSIMNVGKAKLLGSEFKKTSKLFKFQEHLCKTKQNKLHHYLNRFSSSSCLHLMGFPNGNLYFCCIQLRNSLIGNLNNNTFDQLYNNMKNSYIKNLFNSFKWLISTKICYDTKCDVCPMQVKK